MQHLQNVRAFAAPSLLSRSEWMEMPGQPGGQRGTLLPPPSTPPPPLRASAPR